MTFTDPHGWADLLRSLLRSEPHPELPVSEAGAETAVRPPGTEPAIGEVLDRRYVLEERLGRGGAAVVFRARDQLLDLEVAVKVLLLDGLARRDEAPELKASLRQEARAALRLSHPNIVRVHTWESEELWEYLVMEYVPGVDLHRYRQRFEGRRLPLTTGLRIGVDLAGALDYAHRLGVVHNDVKPGNILMDGDRPKICDFGLARLVDRTTRSEVISGSPVYMPPERLRGRPGDAASDQYSLAASLFTILTGAAPFGREASTAIHGHLAQPLPADEHLPAPLDRALRRAMAKEPAQRFGSLAELRDQLASLLGAWEAESAEPIEVGAGTPLSAPRETVPAPPPPTPIGPPPAPAAAAPPRSLRPPLGTVVVSRRSVEVGGRTVEVGPLFADVVPVTNAQYRRFLEATGHPAPAHWFGTRPPPGRDRHPVVGVSLADARAYARWADRRLPTEAEWMSLLRGPDGDLPLPWGAECRKADTCQCPLTDGVDTAEVGARPSSASRDGLLDLLGNVWEWVEPDPRLPAPEAGLGVAVGGSFKHACRRPGDVPRTELSAAKTYTYLGFRCVKDVEVAP